MARFVSTRFDRLLQPGNRLIELSQFNQVGANVVVRIAKIRVKLNRPFALCNRVEQAPLEMVGPAKKRMRFRGRVQIERRLIQFHGVIVVAFHLCLISVLQYFPRASQSLLIHEPIVDGLCEARQRYESASCA